MNETIEGQLNRRNLSWQWLWDASVIFFWLWFAFATMLLGMGLIIFLDHVPLWANLILGAFFLFGIACSVGHVWLRVFNKWHNAVAWFRCEEDVLHYRLWRSRETHQVPLEQIAWVLPKAPLDAPNQFGNVVSVCLTSGDWIYLPTNLLTEVRPLCERLMPIATWNRVNEYQQHELSATSQVNESHELWPRIEPHLVAGETVYWLGTSLSDRLAQTWTMTYLSVPFFFLTGSLLAYGFVEELLADPALLLTFGGVIALLAITICFAFAISQLQKLLRKRKRIQPSVFAITSHRAIAVDAVEWGRNGYVHWEQTPLQTWTPNQLIGYGYLPNPIPAGSVEQWTYASLIQETPSLVFSSRNSQGPLGVPRFHLYQGFLNLDDMKGANTAILQLLQQHRGE